METTIYVNGKAMAFEGAVTVAQLLERLDYAGKRVAVEINREILPRSAYQHNLLRAGDEIEIVQAIGGGQGV